MRRKVGCLCLAGFVVLSAIGAIPVDAGIRPSFHPGWWFVRRHAYWVGANDARGWTLFSRGVLEGDLKAGDSLDFRTETKQGCSPGLTSAVTGKWN
jgi:hypothetical protein